MKKVLIVTATTGKRLGYLEKAANSVLNQDYKNFLYLIVDNSENGDARNFVSDLSTKDTRVRYYRFNLIKFPAAARNAALYSKEINEVGYIKWLDDDDSFYKRNSLRMLVNAFDEDTVMVYGNQIYVDDCGLPLKVKPGKPVNPEWILTNDSFPCSSMIFEKEFLSRIGGFPWLKSSEDLGLALETFKQAKRLGKKIKYVNNIITFYRKHEGGIGFTNRLNGEKSRARLLLRKIYTDSHIKYYTISLMSWLIRNKKVLKNTISLLLKRKQHQGYELVTCRDFY